VLSGVTTKDMLCSDDNTIAPTYYTDKLADLLCVGKVAA
jgi:phosphoglycolate phosphatase